MITVGTVYKNRKSGKLYKVIHISTCTTNAETGQYSVIYHALDNPNEVFDRKIFEFPHKFEYHNSNTLESYRELADKIKDFDFSFYRNIDNYFSHGHNGWRKVPKKYKFLLEELSDPTILGIIYVCEFFLHKNISQTPQPKHPTVHTSRTQTLFSFDCTNVNVASTINDVLLSNAYITEYCARRGPYITDKGVQFYNLIIDYFK